MSLAAEVMKQLEWSGRKSTAPYYMGGPEGPSVRCCPWCGGIHPEEGKGEFIESALGHREGCRLVSIMEGGGSNG